MSDPATLVYEQIEDEFSDRSAATRRRFVAGAAATLGGLGLLSLPRDAMAANDAQTILNVAATAEVLATIVNTVGPERVQLDAVTRRNIEAAARQELLHYRFLRGAGAREATKRIWIPDALFASKESFLTGVVGGDQVFVNAYLIGTTAFARARQATLARYSAEIMGVEAVHRALALQSLGQLGNDRAYQLYAFTRIEDAVTAIRRAGFGLGMEGRGAGRFYEFDEVSRRTPDPADVNTRRPR